MFEIQEIDKRNYNPNVYFSSSNYTSGKRQARRFSENGSKSGRKRVNYSLADMEMQIYQKLNDSDKDDESVEHTNSQHTLKSQVTEKQLLSSQKRFLELDSENSADIKLVPQLLSSLTGVNKDKLVDSSESLHQQRVAKGFELPKNFEILYKSTKPPENMLKKHKVVNNRSNNTNKNKITALKKILASKRSLFSYIEGLDRLTFKVIFKNVYNKRFFKILRLMNICSICGNSSSLSHCTKCHSKICNSLNCYTLHNEARCD